MFQNGIVSRSFLNRLINVSGRAECHKHHFQQSFEKNQCTPSALAYPKTDVNIRTRIARFVAQTASSALRKSLMKDVTLTTVFATQADVVAQNLSVETDYGLDESEVFCGASAMDQTSCAPIQSKASSSFWRISFAGLSCGFWPLRQGCHFTLMILPKVSRLSLFL